MQSSFVKCTLLIFLLTVINCAKRGTIDGGQKDTLAPVLKLSFPKNGAINFKTNEIKLVFDEYIKLKDLNKQLIVSPPMKTPPTILPTEATKYISIKINDTLKPNTTYSFNFGQSIQDNNEGNPNKQFKYLFSTGNYIDSLKIDGKIKDAYNQTVDNFVSIMLYEINPAFKDSVIYKQNPIYVTNTLDSLKTFRLENIKAGKYLLMALKDKNNNNKFNPKEDKIGFVNHWITVPNDSVFELNLFKEILPTKILKPTQVSGNRIIVPYEGKLTSPKIVLKNKTTVLPTTISKIADKDSLQIWFQPLRTDSLEIAVDKKTFKIRINEQKKDSLSFAPSHKDNIGFRDHFSVFCSQPLSDFDAKKIQLFNKDSVLVDFSAKYDYLTQNLEIHFKKEPLEKYKLKLFPNALTTYLKKTNDTLNYKMSTKNQTDYGNLRLILKNIKTYPVIIELSDDKGKTIYSDYLEKEGVPNFDLIEPNKYTLRIIYDRNKNKEWDTGNYLLKTQPEEVIYFPKTIDIRANWDVEQEWKF